MTELIIRGYHLDGYQHVNNARYLEFLEEDRWACMEEELTYFTEQDILWVIVNININYQKAALFGQHLLVSTTVNKIGNKSGVLTQVISCKKTKDIIADAQITFVLLDAKDNKALPITGTLREKLSTCQNRLAQP